MLNSFLFMVLSPFLHNDERVSINSSDGECDFMVCQLVFQLALKKMKMQQNTAS